MQLIILIITLLFLPLCKGDNHKEEKIKVEKAYIDFIDGMKKGDIIKIYELSSEEGKKFFFKLFEDIKKCTELIEKYYPVEEKEKALENIASNLVKGTISGKEFFLNLVDRKKMSDEVTADVIKIKDLMISKDEKATIINEQGNVFVFFLEKDGKWRTDVLLKTFLELPSTKTLMKNLEVVQKNIKNQNMVQ